MRQSFSYEIGSIVVYFYAFFCNGRFKSQKTKLMILSSNWAIYQKKMGQKSIWNLILKTDLTEIGNNIIFPISHFSFHIIAMGRQLCLQLIR